MDGESFRLFFSPKWNRATGFSGPLLSFFAPGISDHPQRRVRQDIAGFSQQYSDFLLHQAVVAMMNPGDFPIISAQSWHDGQLKGSLEKRVPGGFRGSVPT